MAIESISTIKSYLTEGKYPTALELVDIIDTLVSIGQNSGGGDTSGLATVATTGSYNDLLNLPTLFSGSYNDLSDKPTIPTVPAISTNITSDAASDTKTASPKAVKDFVEGKGYLTEHQDISGKADQTDLEALEDRVETLEQGGSGGGDTTQYSYLKFIPDLDAYTDAPVGEIVKFVGQTGKYKRGWDYEKTSVVVPSTECIDVNDTSGRLASIGIPNGRYYKIIDENDAVASKIKGAGFSTAAQYDGGNQGGVMSLNYNSSLNESVGHLGDTGNAFVKISGWHQSGSNSYVDFETGTSSIVLPKGNGLGWSSGWTASEPHTLNYYKRSDVLIFENLQGNRIYAKSYYENNILTGAQVFALEYNEDEDDYLTITNPNYFRYYIKEISASTTETIWQPILMPTASN